VALIRDYDIPAIFTEKNGSDATAQAIARETGVAVVQLDLIMSGEGNSVSTYVDAMNKNLDAIAQALGGN
jgi:zinc transport system substrate-binding protein